jgi:hypothetical protein
MGDKDKIKDNSKEGIVKLYQNQVREAIERIQSVEEKIGPQTKEYIKKLEENIIRAPYVLGYLEWPEEKKKKNKE